VDARVKVERALDLLREVTDFSVEERVFSRLSLLLVSSSANIC